jgi:phosphate starvation-inducible PhoH-like protein
LSKRQNRRAEALVVNSSHTSSNFKSNNTVMMDDYRPKSQTKPITLLPKSKTQEAYIDLLTDPDKLIVFATGPAGTGKTMLAVLAALKEYRAGTIEHIVVTRPAVGVDDEEHGFLPGDLNEKMAPWTRPIFDIIGEYYRQSEINKMLDDRTIEVSPLAFMRGRTFKNSFIIADEMQGSSINQMKMLLTRLGDNSKLVVTGDLKQLDRKFEKDNGLRDFIKRLETNNSLIFGHVEFAGKDIQRSVAVREVLKLYGEE